METYKIRLRTSITVEAENEREAITKACRELKVDQSDFDYEIDEQENDD